MTSFYGMSIEELCAFRDRFEGNERAFVTAAVQSEIDACVKARAVGFNEVLRYDYPLDAKSLVVDVGAYTGEFAQEIIDRFGCEVWCFEPIEAFCASLQYRFDGDARVRILPCALGKGSGFDHVRNEGNATSLLTHGSTEVRIKRASRALAEAPQGIDLLKINVEGGEYDILEDLIDSGMIALVRYLQVQFHDVIVSDGIYQPVPGAVGRCAALYGRLVETHELTWTYPWTWESWERNL